jgi:putative SOS response-associated peptidase YedK
MSEIHTRMPVILDSNKADIWLSPIPLYRDQLDYVLAPPQNGTLLIQKVSTDVNNARHNSKNLIYPIGS